MKKLIIFFATILFAITKEDVAAFYVAMFQRAPSYVELDYWYNDAIKYNRSSEELVEVMLNAAKDATIKYHLEDIYPVYANLDLLSQDSLKNLIEVVYKTLFNKDYSVDKEGIDYWVNEAKENGIGYAIVALINSAKDIANNPDKYKDKFEDINAAYDSAKLFLKRIEVALDTANSVYKIDISQIEDMKKKISEVKLVQDDTQTLPLPPSPPF
jgi:hypothetical protein